MNEIMRDQFEQTVADCMDFKVEFVSGHRMSNDSYSHPGIALAWRWWKRSWVVASAENEALRKSRDSALTMLGITLDEWSKLQAAKRPLLTEPRSLKCLACGEHHTGREGLPCPKMVVT